MISSSAPATAHAGVALSKGSADTGLPHTIHPRRRTLAAFGVALLLGLAALCPGVAGAESAKESADASYYAPAPAPPKGAEVVYVGVEPIQFDGISVSDQSFQATFYIWWRWKGSIDPVKTTDILNSTNSSSNYVVNYSYTDSAGNEKPTKIAGGFNYQTAKISVGVSNPFSVKRYPLDKQQLQIRIENNTYDYSQLVYMADPKNMTKDPEIELGGWTLTGTSIGTTLHHYGTNFGVVGGGPAASQYSQVNYLVHIKRPVSHFVVKLFLPMLVIFTAALAALFVKQDEFDVRLVMVGTGLLTLIFLQQGYGPDLPSTTPGVLMDYIYIAAYIGIAAVFMRVIYTANKIHHEETERHKYIRGDRLLAVAVWVAFLIATAIIVAV